MYRMIMYRSGSNLTSEADKEVRGWNRPFDHVPDDHVPAPGSNLTSEADKEVRGWNRPFDHVYRMIMYRRPART